MKMPRCLRHWRWHQVGDDQHLLSGDRLLARVNLEGAGWWLAYPRVIPEPPIEALKNAQLRAVQIALVAPSVASVEDEDIVQPNPAEKVGYEPTKGGLKDEER